MVRKPVGRPESGRDIYFCEHVTMHSSQPPVGSTWQQRSPRLSWGMCSTTVEMGMGEKDLRGNTSPGLKTKGMCTNTSVYRDGRLRSHKQYKVPVNGARWDVVSSCEKKKSQVGTGKMLRWICFCFRIGGLNMNSLLKCKLRSKEVCVHVWVKTRTYTF